MGKEHSGIALLDGGALRAKRKRSAKFDIGGPRAVALDRRAVATTREHRCGWLPEVRRQSSRGLHSCRPSDALKLIARERPISLPAHGRQYFADPALQVPFFIKAHALR
jgi:hypothetical protein